MDQHAEFLKRFLACEFDLRALIGSVCRDPHVREDVFQELTLVLWQEFSRYDSSRPFGAWARGVATRKLWHQWRAAKRFPLPCSPAAWEAITDAFDRSETSDVERRVALEECLDELPEKSRRALQLRYEQEWSVGEVARDFGVSVAAMYQTLSRVRQQLQRCAQQRLQAEQAVPGETA